MMRYKKRIAFGILAVSAVLILIGIGISLSRDGPLTSLTSLSKEAYQTEVEAGKFVFDGNKTRFQLSDGKYLTGFQVLDGSIYYFDKDGIMLTGKQKIKGTSYTFTETGKLSSDDGFWTMEPGDKKPSFTPVAMSEEEEKEMKEAVGYILPPNYKEADVSEAKPDSSLTGEDRKAAALSSLVFQDVISGKVYEGTKGLVFGFTQDDGLSGGLRCIANPYGVTFSVSMTGERGMLIFGNSFDVFLNGELAGTVEVGNAAEILSASQVDDLYGRKE